MTPIITKEEFKDAIEYVKLVIALQDDVYDLCRKFNNNTEDIADIQFPTGQTKIIDLLSLILRDEEEWISYFVYELEFGMKYQPGYITDPNGHDIPLKTVDDLWNLLMDNFKNSEDNK